MRKEFEEIPHPLQKQILLRLGFGLVFLVVLISLIALKSDIYTILPGVIMVIFCTISAFHLFFRAASKNYVTINGVCTETAHTLIRKRTKTLYLKAENYTIQVSPRFKPRHIPEGASIILYVSCNTPVFERNGIQILHGYLAMEVKGDSGSDE